MALQAKNTDREGVVKMVDAHAPRTPPSTQTATHGERAETERGETEIYRRKDGSAIDTEAAHTHAHTITHTCK